MPLVVIIVLIRSSMFCNNKTPLWKSTDALYCNGQNVML